MSLLSHGAENLVRKLGANHPNRELSSLSTDYEELPVEAERAMGQAPQYGFIECRNLPQSAIMCRRLGWEET